MSALKRNLFYVFRNAFNGLYKMTPAKIIALGFAFLIFFGGRFAFAAHFFARRGVYAAVEVYVYSHVRNLCDGAYCF